MDEHEQRRRQRSERSGALPIVVGLLLIGAGVIFLVMQAYAIELPFDLGRVGWPLFIIAPGVVLLLVGLFLPAAPGSGLTVGGGIVTAVGLLLAYQSSTNHYASWAYAWALVAPFSVGVAMLLWGVVHGRGAMIRVGLGAMFAGAVLFLIGFAFFEGVLNLGGERGLAPLGRQALPVALIAAGVLIIVSRIWPSSPRGWPGPWPAGSRSRQQGAEWSTRSAAGESLSGSPAEPPTDLPTDPRSERPNDLPSDRPSGT